MIAGVISGNFGQLGSLEQFKAFESLGLVDWLVQVEQQSNMYSTSARLSSPSKVLSDHVSGFSASSMMLLKLSSLAKLALESVRPLTYSRYECYACYEG